MPALSPPDRLPVTPAGLVVVKDGVAFVVAVRRTDTWWYVCRRDGREIVARWRFRLKRHAMEFRNRVMQEEATRTRR